MVWFRFRSRVSIEIDDLRLSASFTLGGSRPDRPVRHGLRGCCDLVDELADYTTPSDLSDLEAVLDRYDDADTREIRGILEGQARHRLVSPRGNGPLG